MSHNQRIASRNESTFEKKKRNKFIKRNQQRRRASNELEKMCVKALTKQKWDRGKNN